MKCFSLATSAWKADILIAADNTLVTLHSINYVASLPIFVIIIYCIISFRLNPGNTKEGKYHCTVDLLFDWFGISCMTTDNFCFYLQNRLIHTGQTGGQWYNDTFPFPLLNHFLSLYIYYLITIALCHFTSV